MTEQHKYSKLHVQLLTILLSQNDTLQHS